MHGETSSNKHVLKAETVNHNDGFHKDVFSRRAASHLLALSYLFGAAPAMSFDNALLEQAKYDSTPKRRGQPPNDLGIKERTINDNSINADPRTFDGLRTCFGKPNCFSTTGDDLLEDRIQNGVDTLIQSWKPPTTDASPFKSLVRVVKDYEPGQGFIDGGGFKVIKETDNYIYVQFESLKKSYVDDVEFFLSGGVVQVRSGSRVGATDFGVNAKRLNYIADPLRKEGWNIVELTEETHPDYFYAAKDAADQTFDADRRKGSELEGGRMERPTLG